MPMKIYSVMVLRRSTTGGEPQLACSTFDVSDLRMWERGSAKEFLVFLSRTMASRMAENSRILVKEKDQYHIVAQSVGDTLAFVAITSQDYPMRVAFSMLTQLTTQFVDTFRGKYETIGDGHKDNFLGSWAVMEAAMTRYQNPQEADALLRVQKQIEETHVTMLGALDEVLKRGENIDNLVAQSADLSSTSKTFYRESKKANSSCCIVM
jgi:synaptobrevin family protein YKT6